MKYNGDAESFDDNDYGPEYCADNVDNRHCACWLAGDSCCDCGDTEDEGDGEE